MAGVSFGMDHWRDLWAKGVLTGRLWMAQSYDSVNHFFRMQIPAYFSWFPENWRDVFRKSADFLRTVLQKMEHALTMGAHSCVPMFRRVVDGFEKTIAALPNIPSTARRVHDVRIETKKSPKYSAADSARRGQPRGGRTDFSRALSRRTARPPRTHFHKIPKLRLAELLVLAPASANRMRHHNFDRRSRGSVINGYGVISNQAQVGMPDTAEVLHT
jgi:hypothetical protein